MGRVPNHATRRHDRVVGQQEIGGNVLAMFQIRCLCLHFRISINISHHIERLRHVHDITN